MRRKAALDDLQEIEIRSYLQNIPSENHDAKELRKIWSEMNIAENVIDYVLQENQPEPEQNDESNFVIPTSPQHEPTVKKSARKAVKTFKVSQQSTPKGYSINTRRSNSFKTKDRSEFIQMIKKERELDSDIVKASYNSSLSFDCSEIANEIFSNIDFTENNNISASNIEFSPVKFQSKIDDWVGHNIYHNLSESSIHEFDDILRESQHLKYGVLRQLHVEKPINYEYNPNKSRTRVNYEDAETAENRTKNNLASRRARNRKKYSTIMQEFARDFDEDENKMMDDEIEWLKATIGNLEKMFISSGRTHKNLINMRREYGLI